MQPEQHDLSKLRIRRDEPTPAMKRALRGALGFFVIAVVVVVAAFWFVRGGQAVEVEVASVELVGASAGPVVGITANGYVVARTKASVSSKITGRLEFLGVEEGSHVRRGEVIARVENRDYQAAVAQAEAEFARARAAVREAIALRDQLRRDATRAQELFADSLISRQNLEDTEARLEAAEARVGVQEAFVQSTEASRGVAEANLESTFIRAPFDGTVLRKEAEVGEVVAPVATGSGLTRGAVVTMADLETLEVEVDVNEAYIAQIESDQPGRIILDAYPGEVFAGAVRQIVPTADRQRATVMVKVSILDEDSRILPEMAARVEFVEEHQATDESSETRIFVPAEAVRNEGGESIVWLVRTGVLERRVVDAGPVSGGRREIRSGLSGGERVVVSGPETIQDGANATIVESEQ